MSEHGAVSELDLDAYCRRIQYVGPRQPSLETLNALILAHTSNVPFENLDVLLDVPISLELTAIMDKIVTRRRGGYCFEQNNLFAEVLISLGFAVTRVSARVRIDSPRSRIPPRTHLFCRVDLEGQPWLVDVGVGGLSPTRALRLDTRETQQTAHEPRRIIALGEWDGLNRRAPDAVLIHQAYFANDWHDVCEFTLEPMAPIDCVVGNWFTSTHPDSHFKGRLMIAKATPDGRVTLLNRTLTTRFKDESSKVEIGTPEQLLATLRDVFGIELPADTYVWPAV